MEKPLLPLCSDKILFSSNKRPSAYLNFGKKGGHLLEGKRLIEGGAHLFFLLTNCNFNLEKYLK